MPSSPALARAKARYYQKNKDLIREKTRQYRVDWCRRRRQRLAAWANVAAEFRAILLAEDVVAAEDVAAPVLGKCVQFFKKKE